MGKVLHLDHLGLWSVGLFQPDTILGTQWQHKTALSAKSPELRFWIAFFLLTVQDAEPLEEDKIPGTKGPQRKKVVELTSLAAYNKRQWARWQKEARAFIACDDYDRGSFRWVCDILGFEPDRVREALETRWETGKRTRVLTTLKCVETNGRPMRVGVA